MVIHPAIPALSRAEGTSRYSFDLERKGVPRRGRADDYVEVSIPPGNLFQIQCMEHHVFQRRRSRPRSRHIVRAPHPHQRPVRHPRRPGE